MSTVTLGLIQSCTFASPAQSLQRHEQLIAEAAGKGAQVVVETTGPQEQAALDAILALIADRFGEGE